MRTRFQMRGAITARSSVRRIVNGTRKPRSSRRFGSSVPSVTSGRAIRNTRPTISLDDLANLRWKCGTCEEWHTGPCLDFGYDAPFYWRKELKGTAGSFLTEDYCAIEDESFFVRVLIHLPILGTGESFRWGVSGSLSRDNFRSFRPCPRMKQRNWHRCSPGSARDCLNIPTPQPEDVRAHSRGWATAAFSPRKIRTPSCAGISPRYFAGAGEGDHAGTIARCWDDLGRLAVVESYRITFIAPRNSSSKLSLAALSLSMAVSMAFCAAGRW